MGREGNGKINVLLDKSITSQNEAINQETRSRNVMVYQDMMMKKIHIVIIYIVLMKDILRCWVAIMIATLVALTETKLYQD